MSAGAPSRIGLSDPDETWKTLARGDDAMMIDVRTRAEWAFVGAPDLGPASGRLAFVEWTEFPGGRPNPGFLDSVEAARRETGARRIYFLCRSGGRSQAAALAAAAHFAAQGEAVECVNVVEGFEGDLDEQGRRGRKNGWKARGLPWRQS